jgi:hypothetical protein
VAALTPVGKALVLTEEERDWVGPRYCLEISGEDINLLRLPGFRLCTVHPKPSLYTDYTILDLPTVVFGSLINTKSIFILLQRFTKLLRPERTHYYLYIINRF